MSPRLAAFSCAALILASAAVPAHAGEHWHKARAADFDSWRAAHEAVYGRENLIAFLEADPQTDDGYKAPIIARARAETRRLQAVLGRPLWRWPTSCCYGRRQIYVP